MRSANGLNNGKKMTEEQVFRLYEKVKTFLLYQPWEYFTEHEIIVVNANHPSKQLAFCHTTGYEESFCSFSIYVGESGYNACFDYYDAFCSDEYDAKYLNTLVRRECLEIFFEPYDSLTDWEKEIFEFMNLVNLRYSKLYPRIKYQTSEYYPIFDLDERLCEYFINVLSCATRVLESTVHRCHVSNIVDSNYAVYQEVDNEIVCKNLYIEDYVTVKENDKTIFINDLLVHRIKRLRKMPITIEAVQFYLPPPFNYMDYKNYNDDYCGMKYDRVYGFVESKQGQVLCIYHHEEAGMFNPTDVLNTLAKACLDYEFRPDFIITSDQFVYDMLENFCNQIEVDVVLDEDTEVAQEFVEGIYQDVIAKSERLDEENSDVKVDDRIENESNKKETSHEEQPDDEELIIAYIISLYDNMAEAHLMDDLSEGAKKYYKQIICIFGIEMVNWSNEVPLNWRTTVAYNVIQTRLEVALGLKMWVYAHEVLEHFVTEIYNITDEEEVLVFLNTINSAFS